MRLSIITINYNNSIGLHKTIESVVSQTDNTFDSTFQPFCMVVIYGYNTESHNLSFSKKNI